MPIYRQGPIVLPKFKIDSSTFAQVPALGNIAYYGNYRAHDWTERPYFSDKRADYPVCWSKEALDKHFPGPVLTVQELYSPARKWGTAGTLMRLPRILVLNVDIAAWSAIVAAMGPQFDAANIHVLSIPFLETVIGVGMPMHQIALHTYVHFNITATIPSIVSDATMFIGGELLIFSLAPFDAFSVVGGHPTAATLLTQTVQTETASVDAFISKSVKYGHHVYYLPIAEPEEQSTGEAEAHPQTVSTIAGLGSRGFVGHQRGADSNDFAGMNAAVADEAPDIIRSFFGIS